jgi:hypothetical protein
MQIAPLWFCICNSNPMVGTIMFFSTCWEFDYEQIVTNINKLISLFLAKPFANYFV